MWSDLPLFPEQASGAAARVDALYIFLIAISLFFSILIATLLIVFAVKFRRRPESPNPAPIEGSIKLEVTWTIVPLGIAMGIFVWGASVYFHLNRPPDDTMNVNVVGKRWMWKLQHETGRREINELHIPVGRAVRLNMTSEDVIHSFFVPAFRTKADVLPGRYSTVWFRPTKPGRYHLFCAEYCGTKHSGMIGWVTVMEPAEFQVWLGGGPAEASPAAAGGKIFKDLGCATCHSAESGARGPMIDNLYGSVVRLQDGRTAAADDAYIRESILDPTAKIVVGYQPVMPTFKGLITEEGILQVIEYIKSLRKENQPAGAAAPAPAGGPAARPSVGTRTDPTGDRPS